MSPLDATFTLTPGNPCIRPITLIMLIFFVTALIFTTHPPRIWYRSTRVTAFFSMAISPPMRPSITRNGLTERRRDLSNATLACGVIRELRSSSRLCSLFMLTFRPQSW